jgi:acetyltransferase-like isoleucine patch superfamily enzyme
MMLEKDKGKRLAKVTVHETAEIATDSRIGQGTRVWHQAQVRDGVRVGENCVIGKGVYVDSNIIIGDNVKIQNRASLFLKVVVENNVNIGPHVCFSRDREPNQPESPKGLITLVKHHANIGSGSVVRPGIEIGAYSVIGSSSVVVEDVPSQAYVVGNPAQIVGYVCTCGRKLSQETEQNRWHCSVCNQDYNF